MRLGVLSCHKNDFESMRNEMKEFSRHLVQKYGSSTDRGEVILQYGMQLFHITE